MFLFILVDMEKRHNRHKLFSTTKSVYNDIKSIEHKINAPKSKFKLGGAAKEYLINNLK